MGNVQVERPCYGGANRGAKPEFGASQQQRRSKKNTTLHYSFVLKTDKRGDIAREGRETEEKSSDRQKKILY